MPEAVPVRATEVVVDMTPEAPPIPDRVDDSEVANVGAETARVPTPAGVAPIATDRPATPVKLPTLVRVAPVIVRAAERLPVKLETPT
jgi:hypothetical protein